SGAPEGGVGLLLFLTGAVGGGGKFGATGLGSGAQARQLAGGDKAGGGHVLIRLPFGNGAARAGAEDAVDAAGVVAENGQIFLDATSGGLIEFERRLDFLGAGLCFDFSLSLSLSLGFSRPGHRLGGVIKQGGEAGIG